MNKIICKNCGHSKFIIGIDIADEKCEICGEKMIPENENSTLGEAITLEELVVKDCVDKMQDNLISLGNRRTWEIIEKFTNPLQRIAYRRLFFEAGGKI